MAAAGVKVRRVGFRFGTDRELAAMHLVESEIECERWPGREPQPLERYLAFARSLPSLFDDHTWLAAAADGTPVGCSACWSNATGDPKMMQGYVYVRPLWRIRGVGRQLAGEVIEEARRQGRSLLVWTTYGSVPAGERFSRRIGGRVARVGRNSELDMGELNRDLVESWIADGPRRAMGYSLEFWEGPFPPALLDDAARFQHIMNTAPRDDLDVGDASLMESDQVAEIDRHLVEAGRQRWTLLVRSPDRTCIGGTEMTFESWEPTVGFQQNTAIHPDHRGQGLAKWAKAAMLARIIDHRPEVKTIRTGNASSNEPMLGINTALGFDMVEVRTDWQGDTDVLHASLP